MLDLLAKWAKGSLSLGHFVFILSYWNWKGEDVRISKRNMTALWGEQKRYRGCAASDKMPPIHDCWDEGDSLQVEGAVRIDVGTKFALYRWVRNTLFAATWSIVWFGLRTRTWNQCFEKQTSIACACHCVHSLAPPHVKPLLFYDAHFVTRFDSKNSNVSNSTYCFLRLDMGIQFSWVARCDSYLFCAAHLAGRVASHCWADSKGVQKQSICKDLFTEKHVNVSVKGFVLDMILHRPGKFPVCV